MADQNLNVLPSMPMEPMPITEVNIPFQQVLKPGGNRPDAVHATSGAEGFEGCLYGVERAGMEVYSTSGGSLVLVDRKPLHEAGGATTLRSPIRPGSSTLKLVGELDHVSGSVWHGLYSGLLGSAAVLMDQYVQLRNCVPITIIRVITRVNGPSLQRDERPDDLVKKLLDGLGMVDPGVPAPEC